METKWTREEFLKEAYKFPIAIYWLDQFCDWVIENRSKIPKKRKQRKV